MLPHSSALRRASATSLHFLALVLTIAALLSCCRYAKAQVVFNGAASTLASAQSGDTISPPAVDANGDLFYVVGSGSGNTLYEIPAGGSPTVLNSAFPQFPSALAVNPAGTTLYFIYNGSTPQSCLNNPPYSFGVDDFVYLAAVSTTPNASPTNMPECFFLSYNAFYSDPTGLATDSSGNLYVADFGAGAIWKLSAPVTSASKPSSFMDLNQQPYDIAVNGGTIYYTALDFSNSSADTLYSVSASQLSPNLPSGAASVSTLKVVPSIQNGLAVDGSSNVYIGTGTSVDKYSGGNLTVVNTTVSGGASGVAVDPAGHLYVTGLDSSDSPVVADVSSQSVNFGTINVASASAAANLAFTIGASHSTTVGSVHIYTQGADSLDFSNAGSSTCTATTYASSTNCVVNVSLTPRATGARKGAVVFYDGSGNMLATVYLYGTGAGPQVAFGPGSQSTVSSVSLAAGVAVDATGNVYASDSSANQVVKVPWTGSSFGSAAAISTGLNNPAGIAVDGAGNVYFADRGNNRVAKLPWNGTGYGTISTVGTGLVTPEGVSVDGVGNVYIADEGNNRAVKIPWTGSSYGTQSTVGSGLSQPDGTAVDASGNLYIADSANNRVVKEPWTGTTYGAQTTVVSGVSSPAGVAVDGAGDVYVADSLNNRVVRVPWNGSSYSTAIPVGSGLSSPSGVALDKSGNVYISDNANNRVVKVDVADAPTLSFASSSVGVESSDSPELVTVANIGNAALAFPIPSSGKNPSVPAGFALDAVTTCPQLTSSSSTEGSLGSGADCIYAIDFIPTVAGSNQGSVVLKNDNLNASAPGYATQSISVSGTATSITLSPASLPSGTVGVAYLQTFSASGGTGPYSFAVTAGTLPAGISLGSSGTISGTPTAGGTFIFTVTTTDSTSATSSQAYTLSINAAAIAISPTTLTSATDGAAFSQIITASGGTAPYTYAITSGALPAGITLSSSGVLSGTPTAGGAFTFAITAVDGSTGTGPYTGSRLYTLTVNAPTILLSPAILPSGTYNTAYSQTLSGSGGTAPYTYTVISGTPPTGLLLSPNGVLAGTPTAAGPFTFTVGARDSSAGTGPFTGSQTYTVVVGQATQSITFIPLLSPVTYGIGSIPLSATATSGLPVTFSVVSGPGTVSGTSLNITGAGTIVVAANQAGNANYIAAAQVTQSITVNPASQTITFSPLVSPVTYTAGPIALLATATSSLPVTFSVVSGPGTITGNSLNITGAGTIVIAANQAGNSNYTAATQVTQSITVNPASQTITFTPLASPVTYGVGAIPLSATATSSLPVTFSVVSGPGTVTGNSLNITGAGTIVIAANQAGNSNYTAATQVTQSVTVNPASQTITFTPLVSPVTYGIGSITLSATASSTLPVTFSVVSGPGAISANSLSITGTGTIVIAANQAGNTNYTAAAQVTQSIVVGQANLTVAAANATRVYGTANPNFTGTITGAVSGDTFTESFSTSASITSNAGTYAIVPSPSGTNLSDYVLSIQNGTLTITQAGSAISLSTSNTNITPGQSVTLTTQVTSATTGTPTGTVSFYDGSTLLGTSALASGSAVFSTSSLSAGTTHLVTAVYGGDTNFTGSSTMLSTSVIVAQLDFNLTIAGPASQTVVPGSAINYQVTIDPLYGSYAGPVSFTATGLPPGATITLNPSTIPANGGKQTVTITIQTESVAQAHPSSLNGKKIPPIALGLLLLPFAGAMRLRKHGKQMRRALGLMVLLGGMMSAAGLMGCGSSNGFFAQKQQTYDVTITAAAGAITHSATVTLQVQ